MFPKLGITPGNGCPTGRKIAEISAPASHYRQTLAEVSQTPETERNEARKNGFHLSVPAMFVQAQEGRMIDAPEAL